MKENYRDMYKQLVHGYYNRNFEEVFEHLMTNEFEAREEAKEVLSTLCGVENEDIADDYMFMQHIVDSITHNRVREKIIQKVKACGEDCEQSDGKSKCQSVCPFDAILKDPIGNDKFIDPDLCISCGRCVTVCDHGNYLDTPQFLPLASLLNGKNQVLAIVAPAIAGQFGEQVSLDQMREAFIKLGFTDMVEVAMAADILSFKEAYEFHEHVSNQKDIMISSCCCPVWVSLLRKVYYNLIDNVTPSVSPMIAMGRILKKLNPDAKVVFVGPCIAKKTEAKEKDIADAVDFVLTFQEVSAMFEAVDIKPEELVGVPSVDYAATGGRLYGRSGGVSEAVHDIVDQLFPDSRTLFTKVQADGVPDCRKLLDKLMAGEVKATFVEGMGCPGGCVGGPKRNIDRELGKEAVNKEAYSSAIKIPVHSEILRDLLHRIGVEDMKDLKYGNSMFERDFH